MVLLIYKKTKLDTLQAINNFTINVYKNRQILDNDIKKLRKEVRNQYIEMSDLFKELKDASDQADYNKNYLNIYESFSRSSPSTKT